VSVPASASISGDQVAKGSGFSSAITSCCNCASILGELNAGVRFHLVHLADRCAWIPLQSKQIYDHSLFAAAGAVGAVADIGH
jgi:hypothetical protein